MTAYVTNGEYGRILEPYFELSANTNIRAASRPSSPPTRPGRSRRSSAFSASSRTSSHRISGNATASPEAAAAFVVSISTLQERLARNRVVRSTWRALPSGVRGRIDRDFKELKYQADIRNRVVEAGRADGLDDLDRDRLTSHFAADRELLRTLIDREPPW